MYDGCLPERGSSVRGVTPLGRKGAAFAAFGDIEAVFFAEPLRARVDGVKLGESTLRRFLLLIRFLNCKLSRTKSDLLRGSPYLSVCSGPLTLRGSWLKAQPCGENYVVRYLVGAQRRVTK